MEINQNNVNQDQMPLPEPTVTGTYGHGWKTMKKNFPELLLVLLIQVLLSLPVGFTRGLLFGNLMTTGFFQLVYSLLVLGPVSYGSSWVFLKAVRGRVLQGTGHIFRLPVVRKCRLSADTGLAYRDGRYHHADRSGDHIRL